MNERESQEQGHFAAPGTSVPAAYENQPSVTKPINEADRELLASAANAADIDHISVHADGAVYAHDGCCLNPVRWNPLEDDGDALRLAVKLGLSFMSILTVGRDAATMEFDNVGACSFESNGTNPYAATRRAIVVAAAEIGKVLP